MPNYVENALKTYCDKSQTYLARTTAENVLKNAGFSSNDLRKARANGAQVPVLFFFAA